MFTTTELFGKIHTAKAPALAAAAHQLRQKSLCQIEHLVAPWIPQALWVPGPEQRQRLYTTKLTGLSFLKQVLHPGSSCRKAVLDLIGYYHELQPDLHLDPNTSAYCQARARLELSTLENLRSHLAQAAQSALPQGQDLPPRTWLLDGTCLLLPDTPENQAAYPQPSSQRPGCGFPQLRLVGLFDLSSGVLAQRRFGTYRTSETSLARQLWSTLSAGDLVVGDRLLGDYPTLATLQVLQLYGLFRLHAHRAADFRKGRKLGHRDRLVTWLKARNRPAGWTQAEWAQMPPALTVRLLRLEIRDPKVRLRQLTLVTTLLDPKRWPKELLGQWFCRRWRVEMSFDDLKTTLQMDMLSCRTPEMIAREVEMHLVAYNLIRLIMVEASQTCHVPLERLSFKGSLDAMDEFAQCLAKIPLRHVHRRQATYAKMLAVIAEDRVPERPGRREPRCLKRRPKAYPRMTKPRHEMRDPPKSFRRIKKPPKLN